jgi:di/tricarboxylate transporter
LRLSPGRIVGLLGLACGALLWFAPGLAGLPAELGPIAGLATLCLSLFAGGAVPEYLTALILFAVATVFGLAPPEIVFAGFTSTALWLVFGGLVIGAAAQRTGLGRRLARMIASRLQGSYRRVVYGVVLLSLGFAFLLPSTMGRVVILVPIVAALAEAYGFRPGRAGHTGLIIAAVFGTFFPPLAILPANLPNMVLLGAMETLYGLSVSYGYYLLLHFPVLGALKAVLIAECVVRMLPDEPASEPLVETMGPWIAPERRLLAILLLALAAWMTDFAHGVSPGWVALAAGCVTLFPPLGLVPPEAFGREINFASFFYVAGILGLGSLVATSGLGDLLAGGLLALAPLSPGTPVVDFFALVVIGVVVGLFATQPGIPAVLSPLAGGIAQATGLPLTTVLMTQVPALSAMPFPYQSPPVVVGLQLGRVGLGPATRVCLVQAAITLVVLLPLQALWWHLIGAFE